jgi:hypothetical protein
MCLQFLPRFILLLFPGSLFLVLEESRFLLFNHFFLLSVFSVKLLFGFAVIGDLLLK